MYHVYRIRSIRRRGYYLFHRLSLCGVYLRAATNRERRLIERIWYIRIPSIHKAVSMEPFLVVMNSYTMVRSSLEVISFETPYRSTLSHPSMHVWNPDVHVGARLFTLSHTAEMCENGHTLASEIGERRQPQQ